MSPADSGSMSGSGGTIDWRLFIALVLPEAAKADIARRLTPYQRAHPLVRWLDPASWHLTLLFLGSVPATDAPHLGAVLDEVAAQRRPIELTVKAGGGRLQRGREGVAWLRVESGAAAVLELAAALQERVSRSWPDRTAPKRTPAAHLSVARRASAELVADLRSERLGPIELASRVSTMALQRSHLAPGGAHYETLHSARCTLHSAESEMATKSPSAARR